jgi:hypothetical protein
MDCPSRLTGSMDLWTQTLLESPYALQDSFYVLTGLLSYCSIQTLVLRSDTPLLFTLCITLPSYDHYFLQLLYASLCFYYLPYALGIMPICQESLTLDS